MFFNGYIIILHLWFELSALLMFIFILNRSKIFRHTIMNDHASLPGKLLVSIAFGMIGIFGTYWGIPVVNGVLDLMAFGNALDGHWMEINVDGIANTRAVGVIVGGLIGGRLVGTGAGLIAGIHRIFAFTTFSAEISGCITIVQGILAGFMHKKIKNTRMQWRYGLFVGLVMEALHMLILYMLGHPVENAVRLVSAVTPAMLITNSIGVAVFIGVLESGHREKEKTEALSVKLALMVANKTMTFLRAGLDEQSAAKAANIIYDAVEHLDGVAIISKERILAFVGSNPFNQNCAAMKPVVQVFKTGNYTIYQKGTDICRTQGDHSLGSQVVVPIKVNKQVIAALVLYRQSENSISLLETELACGLAELISTQIEIGQSERQANLLANAEVKALQAQINPHFLFNALNTIGYYCRKQPETAKRLIVHLGQYYRNNLVESNTFVTLQKEIQCVDDYVKIEMARFEGRLNVYYQVETSYGAVVPALILQPLVENAIKHGINPKENGGNVWIIARQEESWVELTVADDGVGMDQDLVNKVLEYDPGRKSIGLCNVHRRLISLYGPDYGLRIASEKQAGTRILLRIPLEKGEREHAIESSYCG